MPGIMIIAACFEALTRYEITIRTRGNFGEMTEIDHIFAKSHTSQEGRKEGESECH